MSHIVLARAVPVRQNGRRVVGADWARGRDTANVHAHPITP